MHLFGLRGKEFLNNFCLGYASVPELFTIELSYNCMFCCRMCNMWSEDFKKSRAWNNRILSKSELEKIITDLSSKGVASILFWLREPFLRNDFLDIVAFCKFKALRCSAISNEYLVGEDLAFRIFFSGVDLIGVSLDSSFGSLHDEIRGFEGGGVRAVLVMHNLRELQEESGTEVPEVFINYTVSSMKLCGKSL